MNFWTVLADHNGRYQDFLRIVQATPLSQQCFENAKELGGPALRAAMFFVLNRQSRQGLGRDYCTPTSRLRRGMNENVSAWLSAVDGLPEFHARLRRVEIRTQDALDFIRELDSPETVFYCDPPYLHETRSSTGEYGEHEMTPEQHLDLLRCLSDVKGTFLLSGYRNAKYDETAAQFGWHRVDFEIPNQASGKKQKQRMIECVWCNFRQST